MKQEFLKEMGLEQNVIDKIMAESTKDADDFKVQVSTLETERDGLKNQLEEADKQIEGFKELDVEGVKKTADEWKAKAEQAEADSAAKIAELKFGHALESKLAGSKTKDAAIVASLLDRDALKLSSDGSILGLDEQLGKIKEEKGFLFEPDDNTPYIVRGGTGGSASGGADDSTLRAAMGLSVEKGDK